MDRGRLRVTPARRRWVVGWAFVAAAAALAVVNLTNEFTEVHFLPGAHTPFYLLLLAASGMAGASLLAGGRARDDSTRRNA